jgi:drug/metabolite transporter (DMT)-like permease
VGNHILSIAVAFVAYSMLDLGKAFQKVGLSAMSRNRGRGMGIWFAGSAATSASSFLILYAVSLGSVLIVGSMAGTGLAAVTLLTVLMMKTPVKRHELAGVACIMAAPFLLASVYQEPPATRLVVEHLFYFLGAVLAVFTLLILIFRRSAKLLGILLAGSAGALGGFVILFQKISTSALGRAASLFSHLDASGSGPQVGHRLPVRLVHVFTNPFAVAWIGLSLVSTLVLQLSYRRGEAIRLIPPFNGTYILIPILGGVFIFREPLHPAQWAGVFLILCGVTVLSFGKSDSAGAGSGVPSGQDRVTAPASPKPESGEKQERK